MTEDKEETKKALKLAALDAEDRGDYREAADLYGQAFQLERRLDGMTNTAKSQMRCIRKLGVLGCT